ncbi:hypothetical protein T484DRAFT_1834188 [Baffinella frigidus]|nr:hypothetical protein T484DRAFT_1834188 [Cryptophyta sp. CCMP2293]
MPSLRYTSVNFGAGKSPGVTDALGTTGHQWSSCNMKVNSQFHTDWMQHFEVGFPAMLEAGIRVLIYAGEMDYICNYMGNKAWTLALPWAGPTAFLTPYPLSPIP